MSFPVFEIRLKAILLHLVVSCLFALAIAFLVFFVWFPSPYRDLIGGARLFWILVGVDVICGPVLTFVLFNPKKSRRELTLDLSLVILIQLGALFYGVYTLSQTRPIALVYEVDRFVAISLSDISKPDQEKAKMQYKDFPLLGRPKTLGVRLALDGNEFLESIEYSSRGIEPSARPNWWQDYEISKPAVIERMHKITDLRAKLNDVEKIVLDEAVSSIVNDDLFYVPLTSFNNLDGWIVILDKHANIVGYAAVDGFK